MEAVNAGDVRFAVGELSPEEVRKITMVIKVNVREGFEDVATLFFAITSEFDDTAGKKYTAFAKLDKLQPFEPAGPRAFLAYKCDVHEKVYRVGMHKIIWSSKKSWARWENKALEELMGHPQKPVYDFGQGKV
jgi:hypothetical protein